MAMHILSLILLPGMAGDNPAVEQAPAPVASADVPQLLDIRTRTFVRVSRCGCMLLSHICVLMYDITFISYLHVVTFHMVGML